jgi:two-component system response regulator
MVFWQHYYCVHCSTAYFRNNCHIKQKLPEMGSLLKQVNQLLRQANLPGQFPLLVGYYHSELKNLILVSAGLNATLNTGEHQIQISNGVPLGTLGNTYLNQLSQRCDAWQCQVWGPVAVCV